MKAEIKLFVKLDHDGKRVKSLGHPGPRTSSGGVSGAYPLEFVLMAFGSCMAMTATAAS